MKPDDVRHLLGGYATGTLTPEEQRLLFEAALQDQDLFDSLMKEEALREALDSPRARRELIAALEPEPSRWQRLAQLRWPYPVAGAGALAAAALTVILMVRHATPPGEMAAVRPWPSVPEAAQSAAPAPATPRLERSTKRESKEVPKPRTLAQRAQTPSSLPTESAPAPGAEQAVRAATGSSVAAVQPLSSQQAELAEPKAAVVAPPPEPVASPRAETQKSMQASDSAPRPPAVREMESRKRDDPGASVPRSVRTFHSAAPAAASLTASAAPAGFRYTIERSAGPTFTLRVEVNADATVYLFRRTATGNWLAATPGGLALQASTPVTVPPMNVDAGAPAPRVIALVSRTPLAMLARSGPALTSTVEALSRNAHPAVSGASNFVSAPGAVLLVVALDLP